MEIGYVLFESNGTFVAPKGVQLLRVLLVAGGGGGTSAYHGGGPGSGYVHANVFQVTVGVEYSAIVGAGGKGALENHTLILFHSLVTQMEQALYLGN